MSRCPQCGMKDCCGGDFVAELEAAHTEIERLRAENEALQVDAKRYRWLRAASCTHPRIVAEFSGDDLDREIDRIIGSALAAKEEK